MMLLLDSGKFQQFEKNVNIYMLDTAWKTEVLSKIFFFPQDSNQVLASDLCG